MTLLTSVRTLSKVLKKLIIFSSDTATIFDNLLQQLCWLLYYLYKLCRLLQFAFTFFYYHFDRCILSRHWESYFPPHHQVKHVISFATSAYLLALSLETILKGLAQLKHLFGNQIALLQNLVKVKVFQKFSHQLSTLVCEGKFAFCNWALDIWCRLRFCLLSKNVEYFLTILPVLQHFRLLFGPNRKASTILN